MAGGALATDKWFTQLNLYIFGNIINSTISELYFLDTILNEKNVSSHHESRDQQVSYHHKVTDALSSFVTTLEPSSV